jgi:alkanesulfonate monooxygenase SsuD/methylene tetrahydromethanopterin reductase-like flavin-dependent oxidoreductase (luciferase family)
VIFHLKPTLSENSLKPDNRNDNIKFGCYIHQDGLKYKDILNITLVCEKLGYDSIWLKDNFTPWISDYISLSSNNKNNTSISSSTVGQAKLNETTMLECWTTISSLASITTKIKVGAILVNLYRNPSIVAKMASSLDVISNGRLEIGLSAGWFEKEAHAYGFAFPTRSAKVEMLEESVVILRKMLRIENTDAKVSFNGKYYNISNIECNPKPIQKPYIPIWVGGGGKKALGVVAKYADGWNYGLCSYDEYTKKLSILKNYYNTNSNQLGNSNRNYNDIFKAWHGVILLGTEEKELKNRSANILEEKRTWKDSNLITAGTPNTILKEINKYIDIGVTYFTIHFPDLPNTRSLRLFAEYIISHFKNKSSSTES